VGETIALNIGTLESPKNVKIGAQCSDEEKMKFSKLLGKFQDVFAWSYEDIRGFNPALIQHAIPIKEGIKPVKQKQRPINPALKATIQKDLKNSQKMESPFWSNILNGFPIWFMFGKQLVRSYYVMSFTH
jgi:hypothetical protein